MKQPLAIAAIALLTSGCAATTSSRYPSLQPRISEYRDTTEPVAPVVTAEPDAALDQTLSGHAKALEDTATAFTPAADAAERSAQAARGDAPGGDRWLSAQTALGKLDSFRATTSATVTDLEEIAIARARDGKPPYSALESLKARGDTQLAGEIARIATIQTLVPGS